MRALRHPPTVAEISVRADSATEQRANTVTGGGRRRLERLSSDLFRECDVSRGGLDPDIVGERRRIAVAAEPAFDKPFAEWLLVKRSLILSVGKQFFVCVGIPEPRAIGGVNLVDQDNLIIEHSELVLGVDENQPSVGSHFRAPLEQLKAQPRDAVEQCFLDQPFLDCILTTDVAVMFLEFRGRSEYRLRQPLVLSKTLGQFDARDLSLAGRVVEPQRCFRHTGHVRADDELQRNEVALASTNDVGVGDLKEVVRNDVRCRVEPEVGNGVQCLAFEGNRSEDPIEGGLPVGCDDRSNPVCDIAVADLAFVGAPDVNEIRSVKRAFELLGHPLVRYQSDLPHSPRLALSLRRPANAGRPASAATCR